MCKSGNLECTYTSQQKARKNARSVSDMLVEVQSHGAAIEKRLSVLEKHAAQRTIGLLFDSYMMHINSLYPFLDVESLKSYAKEFHHRFLADLRPPSGPPPGPGDPSERQSKRRKRSDNGHMEFLPGDCLDNHVTSENSCAQKRTLLNAIVYLVLALGQICDLREPVTDPARSQICTHVERLGGIEAQALIKLPGGAYYLQACAILGDFSDSNELAHAQACILASLYKGQLGRTEESWSWIHIAARICLYRVKV